MWPLCYIEWAYPRPSASHHAKPDPKWGSKSLPFRLSAKRLEIDENISRAHPKTHWPSVKWCHEQSCSFCQRPKWVSADRAQYVRSLSGRITIVAMAQYVGSQSVPSSTPDNTMQAATNLNNHFNEEDETEDVVRYCQKLPLLQQQSLFNQTEITL